MDFNRFDVSAKELVWDDPTSWLDRLGLRHGLEVEVVDSDITTLSAAADKVIRVGGENPYLVNIELQSSHESTLVRTLWYRQVALDYRHNLPVTTVLVLLRKEANSPALTGIYERALPDGRLTNRYHYELVRLWRDPPEVYLTAGIGLVPLAPLTNVTEPDLPGLISRMAERINREPRPRAAKLWTATCLLMGLRFSDDVTFTVLEGVQNMQESTTYQRILREGRTEGRTEGRSEGRTEGRVEGQVLEAQRLLLRLGRKRFSEPNAASLEIIEAIQDVDRLEALVDRVLDQDVHDWNDLLGIA